MDEKLFQKLHRLFGKCYNFTEATYFRPEQKEYKKLKLKVEKLIKDLISEDKG